MKDVVHLGTSWMTYEELCKIAECFIVEYDGEVTITEWRTSE